MRWEQDQCKFIRDSPQIPYLTCYMLSTEVTTERQDKYMSMHPFIWDKGR